MKLSKLLSIAYLFLLGVMFSVATGINPFAMITGVFVLAYLAGKMPTHVLGANVNSMDLTELVAKLGAYCRDEEDTLIGKLLIDDELQDDFTVYDDIQDELALPNLSMLNIVQPADDMVFNPTASAIKIGARILKVRGCKVDLQIVPSLLEKSWLGHFKSSVDPWDIPFEQYIFDYVIRKAKEDIRLNGLFKGVYNAAGTTPADCLDGWLKIVADEITATTIVPVATGAITEANVVAKLLATYDGLGEAYKHAPSMMKVNPQIFDWYTRKFMAVINPALTVTDSAAKIANKQIMNKCILSGTNAILYREPGLGTSQRVICTTQENWVYGCNTLSNWSFDVQKFDRTIKLLIDFKVGVNFAQTFSGAIAVNDQA